MKKTTYLITAILFFSILIMASTEIYLRYIGLGKPIVYDNNYVYGYAPKINQKKNRINNSIISINDVGLRSIYNWSDNKDSKKIVFFGDSVTYGGSYIDDTKTFVHVSCEGLNKLNIICGNAGVNAYGIHNIVYRSKYDKRIGKTYIKVFILVPDDFYRGLQNSKTAHFYLNERKYFFPGIYEAINFLAYKYDLNKFIGKLDDTKIETNQYDLIDESISVLNKEFKRLRIINQNFLVFYFHPKVDSQINDYIFNKIKLNTQIIDLKEYLKESMYEDSIHLNELGHDIIGDIIGLELKNYIKNN